MISPEDEIDLSTDPVWQLEEFITLTEEPLKIRK
jgi:hypothetical protein